MAGVSFDRAASYYDATRGLPGDVAAEVTDLLLTELAGKDLCLELGVGTGRIALPLAHRGIHLLGVDLAPAMLVRLVANAGGDMPFPLLTADVTGLPLDAGSMDAVLGSHVLHLIPDWRSALDEVRRVLRPDGVLLLDFGGPSPTPWSEACSEILARHGLYRRRPGVSSPDPVADYLRGRVRQRTLPPIRFIEHESLGHHLDVWERQILAWTWPYTPEQMRLACDEIRTTAGSLGWDLDEKVPVDAVIQWWAFDPVGNQ